MQAYELMTPDPKVALPSDSIPHVASLMATLGVGLIPVVDTQRRRRLVGVITDRDIVVRCLTDSRLVDCEVRDHMTTDGLATVAPEATVEEIAGQMRQHQVRRIPVVDATGQIIGIVTQADLARVVGPVNPGLVEETLERVSRSGSLVATGS